MTPCIIHPTKPQANGYVYVWFDGKVTTAHRAAWESAYGTLPDDVHVHHTCETRACVNLDHLESLEIAEHARRHNAEKRAITHCPRGHEYTAANTLLRKRKRDVVTRECRECNRVRCADWYARVGRDRRAKVRLEL